MLKKLFLITNIIIIVMFFPVLAYSTDYYVDYLNGNDTNNCTNNTTDECKTIRRAYSDKVAAGDRVCVQNTTDYLLTDNSGSGGYDESAYIYLNKNGTLASPITLEGYTSTCGDGGVVTLDGQSSSTNILYQTGDYLIFKNLEMINSTSWASYSPNAGTDYLYFINCLIEFGINANNSDVYIIGNDIEGNLYSCASNYIGQNYIHDSADGGGTANGITQGSIGYIVAHNVIDNPEQDGIIADDRMVVFNNTIYGAERYSLNVSLGYGMMIFNNLMYGNPADEPSYHVYGNSSFKQYLKGYNNYQNPESSYNFQFDAHQDLGGSTTTDPQLNTTTFMPNANMAGLGFPPSGHFSTNASLDFNVTPGAVEVEDAGGGSGVSVSGCGY